MSKLLNEDLSIEDRQSFIPPEMELEPVSLPRLRKEKGGEEGRSGAPKPRQRRDEA